MIGDRKPARKVPSGAIDHQSRAALAGPALTTRARCADNSRGRSPSDRSAPPGTATADANRGPAGGGGLIPK
ncbi:hypothetical protein GN316_09490 [Xylophilus sp. Kf1]|nr:hypothetical protein [Xylophilus sp. Kf1]